MRINEQVNVIAHRSLEETGKKRLLFLLPAYATISSALQTLSSLAEEDRKNVQIISPLIGIVKFLRPLAALGIKVQYVEFEPRIRLMRPWTLPRTKAAVIRQLNSLFHSADSITAYIYTTGFSLILIAAIARIARTKGSCIILEDWDHSGDVGLRDQLANSTIERLYALAVGYVLNAPVQLLGMGRPICYLNQDFVHSVCQVVPKKTTSSPRRNISPAICDLVCRRYEIEVLWLYDMYEEFYGEKRIPSEKFQASWLTLYQAVSAFIPPAKQAFKIHPTTALLPKCFPEAMLIEQVVPVEFLETPNLKLVIGLSSYSLNYYLSQEGVLVISPLHFFNLPADIQESENTTLDKWVDPKMKINRPKALQEFHEICQRRFAIAEK